jgi:iron-sulfur cluster repair protein YtfE (RIC family)
MAMVHRGLTVGEVVLKYPEAVEVFERHELTFCAGCFVTLFSEIEKAAGYAAVKDLDAMIADLKGLVERLEQARS